MPRTYYVHAAFSIMDSHKLFTEHPEFGKKLIEWGEKVPSWHYLDSFRPGWVLFKGLKDTTADPKWLPYLHNYRVLHKEISSCTIAGDGDAAVCAVGVEAMLANLDNVTTHFRFMNIIIFITKHFFEN